MNTSLELLTDKMNDGLPEELQILTTYILGNEGQAKHKPVWMLLRLVDGAYIPIFNGLSIDKVELMGSSDELLTSMAEELIEKIKGHKTEA